MLNEQYRMHDSICRFPSRTFYQNQIFTAPALLTRGYSQEPYHASKYFDTYLFFDMKHGQESRVAGSDSIRNLPEIEFILLLIRLLVEQYGHQVSFDHAIGIIAPYKQQVEEIQLALSKRLNHNVIAGIEVNTGRCTFLTWSKTLKP